MNWKLEKTSKYIITAIFLSFISCRNSATSTTQTAKSPTDTIVPNTVSTQKHQGYPIDFEKTAVLEEMFIIAADSAIIYQDKDLKSKKLVKYAYGTKVEVIAKEGEWYAIRERYTRNFLKDDKQIESNRWEKMYLRKSAVGKQTEVQLKNEDLPVIVYENSNDKFTRYEKGKILNNYLKMELIDAKLYQQKLKMAKPYILQDSSNIPKIKGVITLPTSLSQVKYTDKNTETEDRSIYTYIGRIPDLQQYILQSDLYESTTYTLIDQSNGEETQAFEGIPFISTDKKHIISLYANPYEMVTDLSIFSLEGKKIVFKINFGFSKWMPIIDIQKSFWAADGYFYSAVNHRNSFWNLQGSINEKHQYIRIKLI